MKKGENVTNFELGDLAGIRVGHLHFKTISQFMSMCMTCEQCRSGHESSCLVRPNTKYCGTFQQFAITKAVEASKLPKGIDQDKAAPTLCAVSRKT